MPLGHPQGCPRRRDRRALRFDLSFSTHRSLRLREGGLRVLRLGFRRPVVGTTLIDALRSSVSGPQQRFVALEIGPRTFQGRAGIRQVGLRLCDFRRLHCSFQIGQLLFGLGELARCLITGSAFVRVVLRKKRGASGDLITTRHGDRGQQSLLDRRGLDVVGFGIALPRRRSRAALLRPPQPADADPEDDHDDD